MMNKVVYKINKKIHKVSCTDAEIGNLLEWLKRKKGRLISVNNLTYEK